MTASKLQFKNIPEMIAARAEQWYDEPVANEITDQGLQPVYWERYLKNISDISMGLASMGLRMYDRVAILADSSLEWMMADSAALSLGACTVPIFPTYRKRDVEYILKHSEARGVFITDKKQYSKVAHIKEKYGDQFLVISFKDMDEDGVVNFSELFELGRKDANTESNVKSFKWRLKRIGEADLASIIYTSGTTGTPKGVMLTHGNFLANCEACARAIDIKKGMTALSVLPLSHVFERTVGYYLFMYAGVRASISRGLNKIAQEFKIVQPQVATFVPRLFEKFYHRILANVQNAPAWRQRLFDWAIGIGKQRYVYELRGAEPSPAFKLLYFLADILIFKKIKSVFGGKMTFFVSGGAKLPREICRFFYATGLVILEGYGLTETSPVVAVNRVEKNKIGSIGPALDNLQVKVGDTGELLVKGPSVMKGYFRDEDATDMILQDGWLNTGDLASIDEDGYIKILGRKKDIIVTLGGKNISPQMIENVLEADSFISQTFICGDEEKYIAALIVPDFDSLRQYAEKIDIKYKTIEDLTENSEIIAFYKKRIDKANKEFAPFERIKQFCLLPKEFTIEGGELTPTLKVKRNVVLVRYKDYINRLYRRD